MNECRVFTALKVISRGRAALRWIEVYGSGVAEGGDSASVNIRLNHASACPGAQEASEVIGAYARLILPEIINRVEGECRHDIETAIAAIREEVGVAETDVTSRHGE